jgi:hypothetical protein
VRRILKLTVFLFLLSLPAAAQTQQPVRIHCGGASYTDSNGQLWQADSFYSGGTTNSTTLQIGGTADQALYQSGRYNTGSTSLVYSVPVANGSYNVNLLFAETASKFEYAGARVFNVKVQGTLAFPNLDIFAAAGARAALVKSTNVLVQNGVLSVELDNVTQAAKIDAIEILPVPAQAPQLWLNFVYPDGTPVSGTLAYSVTSPLLSFQGNEQLTNGLAQCVLFASPNTVGISAQFQVNLSLTDTAGHLLWQISLQANPAQVNLATVQSSVLNVVVQKI